MGGYRVQGKTSEAATELLDEAVALERAGAFALVLEGVPAEVAGTITRTLSIPTIGIGAGSNCDGQILVTPDLLGMHSGPAPGFVNPYADFSRLARNALEKFVQDVRRGNYPPS